MPVLQELSNAVRDIVRSRRDRVVHIEAEGRRIGSGVLLDDSRAVTAAHSVDGAEDLAVRTATGEERTATLVGVDPGSDIALLRLSDTLAASSGAAAEDVPELGELVVTIAFPSRDGHEAALGAVRCAPGAGDPAHAGDAADTGRAAEGQAGSGDESLQRLRYFQTDTVRFRGFAGSGLFDTEGRLLGVNTFGYGPTAPIAIPAAAVSEIAHRIETRGSISRGYLGIRSQHVELDETAMEKARTAASRTEGGNGALLVAAVEEGSPAGGAGARVGDILIAIGDLPVESHRDLMAKLWESPAGSSLLLTMLRGDAVTELEVTLGEPPANPGGRHGDWRHGPGGGHGGHHARSGSKKGGHGGRHTRGGRLK